MDNELLVEKIEYLSSMPHFALVEYCIYLEQENENYKAQKYITDFISENEIICEKNKQISQLTNNWNELEEWLKADYKKLYRDAGYRNNIVREILDKMKEIKDKRDK